MPRKKDESKGEMTTRSFRLTVELDSSLKDFAAACGKSVSDVMTDLLEGFVAANKKKIESYRRQKNQFVKPTFATPTTPSKSETPKKPARTPRKKKPVEVTGKPALSYEAFMALCTGKTAEQVAAENAELAELERQVNVSALRVEIGSLENEIATAKGTLQDLRDNHISKHPDDESLKEFAAELESEIAGFEAKIAAAKSELTKLNLKDGDAVKVGDDHENS